MGARHQPYAYVCAQCHHLSSSHGLTKDGDLRDGPYICADCGCSVAQEHPVLLLWTKRDYDEFMARTPRVAHTEGEWPSRKKAT